jgi:hypothetical protein
MIEDYLEKHPGPNYASEISCTLGFELDITFKLIHKLLEEGRIRKAKGKSNLIEDFDDKTTFEVIYDVQDPNC